MARQTIDQVFELAHWQNGMFVYDEPEQMPHFQIAIQGNVQELLLDAYRRIDEGEYSRKTVNVVDNEVCYACPLDDECTAIRAKHLKKRPLPVARDGRRAGRRVRPAARCAPALPLPGGRREPVLDASLDGE